MLGPLEISVNDICALNERQLPNLLRRLLIGEARRHNLLVKYLHVPELISMQDGGEDGRIELDQEPPPASRLRRKLTGFQCTVSPLSATACADKLLRRRPATLQPQVETILNAGGEFLLLLTQDLTQQAIDQRVSAMRQVVVGACGSTPDVRVLDANQLRDWCNQHLAAIVAVQNWLGRPQIAGLLTFEEWARYPAYAAAVERTSLVDRRIAQIRDALCAPGQKVLRLRPDDSRLVIEALRSTDLAQRVVYVDLHGARTQIANSLVSFRSANFDGILIADNCPYEEYLSVKTEAEHTDGGLFVVALTLHPDLEAARKLLSERSSALDLQDFGKAIALAESAIELARRAEDREQLAFALRCAIVDATDSLAYGDYGRREQERLIARIRAHLDELETLDQPKARLLLERASLAHLEGRSEDAFRYADMAIDEAEDLDTEAEALLLCLRATWQDGSVERGLGLRERVASVCGRLEAGDTKRLIQADWLTTLCRAEIVTIDDVRLFAAEARLCGTSRRASGVVGKLVADFARAQDWEASRLLLQLAMDLAVELDDPLLIANVALDCSRIEAELGNAVDAVRQLGAARTSADKLKPPGVPGNWASVMANVLRARGDVFSRLAEKTEDNEYGRSVDFRRSTYEALKECAAFALEHESEISGPIGLFRSDIDAALGRAAANLGRHSEAALLFRQTRTEQVLSDEVVFSGIGAGAYLGEATALFNSGNVSEARSLLTEIIAHSWMPDAFRRAAENNLRVLEKSVVPVVDWLDSDAARAIGESVARNGLRHAVAEQTRSLGEWIDELSSALSGPVPFAGLFDQWGRGGFARIVAAVRADPLNAVSVDATSIADIDRMARIFCPLYDTVIVSWKGPLEGKVALFPISASSSNAGIGYSLLSMNDHPTDRRFGLGGWANLLPDEVATYLGTTALLLITSGRLVVIPAPLVGCTQSVIGWTDSLLVDGFLGGIVMSARMASTGLNLSPGEGPSEDLGRLQLPVINGVRLGELGTILDDSAEWLSPLRRLLRMSLGSDDMRQERWARLGPEISDLRNALRELDEKWGSSAPIKAGSEARIERLSGAVTAIQRPGDSPGTEPLTTFARAITGNRQELGPWIPFWRLHNIGATINWAHPLDNHCAPAPRVEIRAGVGIDPNHEGWLYPGEGMPGIRSVLRLERTQCVASN